jgi:hypothetical protein
MPISLVEKKLRYYPGEDLFSHFQFDLYGGRITIREKRSKVHIDIHFAQCQEQ